MASQFWMMIGLCLLLVASSIMAFTQDVVADTIIVDDDGGSWANYTRIQDAIDNTSENDTIRVYGGTYLGKVIVNVSVTLIGNGSSDTFIDGQKNGDVAYISADRCKLSGFDISNCTSDWGYSVVKVKNADNCSITDNEISIGKNGIYLDGSDNGTIMGNVINDLDFVGVYLYYSDYAHIANNGISSADEGIRIRRSSFTTASNNTIWDHTVYGINTVSSQGNNTLIENRCWDNKYGIWVGHSANNTITKNNCSENRDYGIEIAGDDSPTSMNNLIKNNVCIKNLDSGILISGCGYVTMDNNTCDRNVYGIYLYYSNGSQITNSNVTDNGETGLHIYGSEKVTVNHSTFSYNSKGIMLMSSRNGSLHNNSIFDNTESGICLNDSGWYPAGYTTQNIVYKNEIFNNGGYAVNITAAVYSGNNTIYFNNIHNNQGVTSQAYDEASDNHWDNGTHGNYWSDYNGTDGNSDGIGDTSYGIDGSGGAKDRYPLMDPVNTSSPQKIPEAIMLVPSVITVLLIVMISRRRSR